MKYLEVTFTTHPCNETVNDVVSALLIRQNEMCSI